MDPKVLYGYPAGASTLSSGPRPNICSEAIKKSWRSLRRGEIFPEWLRFRAAEARALAALGKIDEVKKVIEGSLKIESTAGTPGDVMMEAASELNVHGHKDTAREVIARAVAWAESRPEAERKTEAGQRFFCRSSLCRRASG